MPASAQRWRPRGGRAARRARRARRPRSAAANSGITVRCANRLTTSRLGLSANAALPGLGLFARLEARSGSPEPHSSGPNQSTGTATPTAAMRSAQLGLAEPQPQPVEAEERPRLRAQQRGGEAEVERVVAAPVEVALERPQRQRGEHRLGVAEHRVAHELVGGEQEERGHDAADHSPAGPSPVRRRPRRNAITSDSSAPARAIHSHSIGASVRAEERERRGEQHRQRLPRRPALGHEVEVHDLAAPHDPGPRVVGGRGREQQRERREGEAADDHRQHRRPERRRR